MAETKKKTVAKATTAKPATKKTAAPKASVTKATAKKETAAKKTTTAKKTTAKKDDKQKLDWGKLPFGYIKADKRFVAEYKDGKWTEGKLITDEKVVLNECACVFQYAQTCFEGLKAYTTEDGKIVCFRPDLNAARMADSCKRLVMPEFPVEKFIQAVNDVVKANKSWVPPYGSGATLYIRPFMFGSNPVIGVKPADEYQFRILVTPVGPYFKGGVKPITIRLSELDRAAPKGTGHIKAGLNYAMSLFNIVDAHKNGFDENMYLDPQRHMFIEETGGANILFVKKNGTLVTPKSNSILPSITRRSIIEVAQRLGLKVQERKVHKWELSSFVECGLCGTAAVISPVGKVVAKDKEIIFKDSSEKMGPVLQKIYDELTGIQMGTRPAPDGWIYEIK